MHVHKTCERLFLKTESGNVDGVWAWDKEPSSGNFGIIRGDRADGQDVSFEVGIGRSRGG